MPAAPHSSRRVRTGSRCKSGCSAWPTAVRKQRLWASSFLGAFCARPARAQLTHARDISDSFCAYNAAGTAMADKTALLITDIYQSDGEQARCEQIGALLDEYLRAMLSEGLAADGDIQ